MSNINSQGIISVLKSEIENYDSKVQVEETGRVISVGDGIANVYGLQRVMYGELVEFENGTTGIAQSLEQKTIGCVLLGSDHGIVEGYAYGQAGRRSRR